MERHSQHTNNLGITDCDFGLYVQPYFEEVLCRERRRSERSGKPFILMLLEVSDKCRTAPGAAEIIGKCTEAIFATKRETDITGWFKRGSIIGVLFTDMPENTVEQALETIEKKLKTKLLQALPAAAVQHIALSFQIFPENRERDQRHEPFNLLFYPDVVGNTHSRKISHTMKRLMDIVGSIFGLILFSPFFAVIPVLIKLTSRGPVLYKQERYGQYGKRFVFLKFRTMHTGNDDTIHREYIRKLITEMGDLRPDAENAGQEPVFKIKNDPRVTPIGKFLRKSSLDELPQFINVLKGDMSLVGPRPPIPYELENYDAWHRHRLLGEKPGITGLWQVYGRSLTTFDGMVRLDLQYIRTWSLWLDLKLILATPMAVLRGKGAY